MFSLLSLDQQLDCTPADNTTAEETPASHVESPSTGSEDECDDDDSDYVITSEDEDHVSISSTLVKSYYF